MISTSIFRSLLVLVSTFGVSYTIVAYATPVVTLSGSSNVMILVGSGVPSSTAYAETTESNAFSTGGVAQGWRGDDSGWDYALPFSFTFYGVTYATGHTIRVSSNGRICLDSIATCNETSGMLASNGLVPTIAPLWRDLYTAHNPTDNIYVTQTSDSLTIRWQATSCCSADEPVNFSATLFRNGQIRFDYGAQPTAYTNVYQQVGISGGTGSTAIISPKTILTTYNFVSSSRFAGALVYDDPGATWIDSTDGSGTILRATSGSVDINTVGTYIITYSYTNTLGQTGSLIRTVRVALPDTTPPVITLSGSAAMTVSHGSTFTDPGAAWTDNEDGSGSIMTATFGSVNTGSVGTYTLNYTRVDVAGNTGSTTRTVNVVDTTPPVVTLVGSGIVTLTQGTTWSDSGATWSDNVDGTGTISTASSGSVNTSVVGAYALVYTKVDAAGNTGSTTRIVSVIALPVVTGGGGGGGVSSTVVPFTSSSPNANATPITSSSPNANATPIALSSPSPVIQTNTKPVTQEVVDTVITTSKKSTISTPTTLKKGTVIIIYRTSSTGKQVKVGTTRVQNGTIRYTVHQKGTYTLKKK